MKDDYGYIRGLLEKYYRGETDPAEEAKLKDFFLTVSGFSKSRSDFATIEDLPADMEADRRLFAALAEAEAFGEVPADLDDRIMAAVEASRAHGVSSLLPEAETPKRKPGAYLRRILLGLTSAAVIALVFMLPFGFDKKMSDNPGSLQLAQEKIMDTLKNMEIEAEIPQALALASIAPQSALSEPRKLNKAGNVKPVKKTKVEAEEEGYTLSEEELRGLEMASKALGNASQALAYAYGCVEDSQTRLAEAPQVIDRILPSGN